MNFPTPQSPLFHGLIYKKKSLNALFRFLNRCFCPSKPPAIPTNPRKILLCNFGHLGDWLTCSRAIAELKATYPSADFSFLIASHGCALFENRGERVHVFDHLYYLKDRISLCKAALQHWKCRRSVLKEIRAEGYDLAVDFRPYFPNAVSLLSAAGIPIRVGYGSAGFSRRLTHCFVWHSFDRYFGDLHVEHLKQVGFPIQGNRGHFFTFNASISRDLPPEFIVVHLCSSKKKKDWPRSSWIELIKKLDCPVILMGAGSVDEIECDAVQVATGALNLCNQVSLSEYGGILKRAKLLISVDSMPVHLAGILSVPTITLFMEVNNPHLWIPSSGI